MYLLTRASLQNWYLISAQDIEIEDATAFIGPIGAGKSSIQDAIQAVICGGNHNALNLNASASGNSSRRVIDYCLGYIKPKADGGEPLRNSCESVIALTFSEQREGGEDHHVTVGLVMRAHRDDSREQVISRFIAPGYRYSVEDFKGNDEAGPYIKAWDDISRHIKANCQELREYRSNGRKFVSDMLAVMRPGERQPDPRHFLHAFSNAIAFKPIFDPTEFVRKYILEPDPLDVDRVRSSIEHWKAISSAAREVEAKIVRLGRVQQGYGQWAEMYSSRLFERSRMVAARVERTRLEYRTSAIAYREALGEVDRLSASLARLKTELELSRQELDSMKEMLAEKGVGGKLKLIEAERQTALARQRELEGQARKLHQAFAATANLQAARQFIPASFNVATSAAESAVSLINGKPGMSWLGSHRSQIKEHLASVQRLKDLPGRLEAQMEGLRGELFDLRRQREEIAGALGRMQQGGSPLSGPTQALIDLLHAEGIEAVPLCDVVEVTDQDWQFAVESLLGPGREALIVDPQDVRKANDLLYRNRNKHGLHRCRLVKSSQTARINVQLASDSIAHVTATDNPHAAAYIAVNIGSFRRVDSEEDLERASRAVMRNGKTTSAMAYSVQRDITLILGRAARERSSADLHGELHRIEEGISARNADLSVLTQASTVAASLGDMSFDLDEMGAAYDEVDRLFRELDARKEAVVSDDQDDLAATVQGLKEEIGEREAEIDEVQLDLNKAHRAAGDAENSLNSTKRALKAAVIEKRRALVEGRDEMVRGIANLTRDGHGNDGIDVTALYAGDRSRFTDDEKNGVRFFREQEVLAREALKGADDRVARAGSAARRALDEYLREFQIDRPIKESHPYLADYTWLESQLAKLEANELRSYREMAENAEREMVFALQEDLLTKLNAKFQMLDIQLRALNQQMRKRKFTNQVYKFGRRSNPAFDRIRKLAVEVGTNPEKAQAIIEGRVEDVELQEAMQDLRSYLEHNDGEGLEDYRNYFTFDLYMREADGAEDDSLDVTEHDMKKQNLMSLSSRATVGSGGEGQAPFYVAIAASMAMAYYPGGSASDKPAGMGLVMFDEAFNKLDIATTQSLIRFFKDLGLQLLLAAPEDKRPTFTEVVDTIVSVNKDVAAKAVYITSEFPRERARRELAAVNPDHKGVEGLRAEMAAKDVPEAT